MLGTLYKKCKHITIESYVLDKICTCTSGLILSKDVQSVFIIPIWNQEMLIVFDNKFPTIKWSSFTKNRNYIYR